MKFNVKDAIEKRYSVRSYDARIVEENIKAKIMEYASTLTNPFGSGIRCKLIDRTTSANGEKLGTYGMIKNANLFIGVSIPKEKGYLEALGYEFEHLVLYMTSLGLGTCWLGGTFNRGAFAEEMNLRENEVFPIISPIGYPAKLSIKDKLIRTSLKADKKKSWEVLFFKNNFDTPLLKEEIKNFENALEMVRLAPSATNQQPWRVIYENGIFHFYEFKTYPPAELDMQRIDVGIAMCHFDLALKEKGINGQFVKRDVTHIKKADNVEYVMSYICK